MKTEERLMQTASTRHGEGGVRRPSEALHLKEHQEVSITISDVPADSASEWLDHEYLGTVDAMDEPEPTLEEVRHALSNITGNLSDDIRAERDAGR